MPDLFAAGGFRVTDLATDTVFVEPGCCNGLETWRDWLEVLDGTGCYFGHDPSSAAERVGDNVRLALGADAKDGSPVIELPVDQVRALVTGAETDPRDFHSLAGTWAEQHLPTHAAAVMAVLARALIWSSRSDQFPDPPGARARRPAAPPPAAQRTAHMPHCFRSSRPPGDIPPPHAQRRIPRRLEAAPNALARAVEELHEARVPWLVRAEEYAVQRRAESRPGSGLCRTLGRGGCGVGGRARNAHGPKTRFANHRCDCPSTSGDRTRFWTAPICPAARLAGTRDRER
nr:hypothetical protein StreXyl84_62900 [Streptomyces sp. Xyl84]